MSGETSQGVGCVTEDREALLVFFDFPAEHWDHLPKIVAGVRFRDGIEVLEASENHAA